MVQAILLLILLVGAMALYFINQSIDEQQQKERALRLRSVHDSSREEIIDAIDNFATMVAGIRAHIKHTDTFPSSEELQEFINDQLNSINYQDSIVVCFMDTSNVFRYCFTRNAIDPAGLVGTSLESFRDQAFIEQIDSILSNGRLYMTDPINLREGWVGIPATFQVENNDVVIGYLSPTLNFKIILDRVYRSGHGERYAFKFITSKGFDFDREQVYDGTKVYSDRKDSQYYKNFSLDSLSFVQSSFSIHGLNMTLATAHKFSYQRGRSLTFLVYGWYLMLLVITGLVVREVFFYRSKSSLEALEKQQAYHELSIKNYAIASSITPIALGDLEGHITYVNKAFVDLWGYNNANEIIGRPNSDFSSSPEKVERIMSALRQTGIWEGEDVARKKDGTKFHIQLSASLVKDVMSRPICTMASVVDITERKRIQQELIEREENIKSLFDNSAIPIWEEDFSQIKAYFKKLKDTGVVNYREYFDGSPEEVKMLASLVVVNRVNQKSLEFYQVESMEELFTSLWDWFVEESWDVFKEELIALAEGKTEFESEIPIIIPTGERKVLLMKLTVPRQFHDNMEKVLVSFVDITEHKQAQIKQLAALQEGERLERKRLAKELHDSLGQHLAACKMMLNSIETETTCLQAEDSDYFKKAQNILDQAIAEARGISHALMPAALQHQGLASAIVELCKNLDSNTIKTNVLVSDLLNSRFDPKIEMGLFRIVQELIGNILKHAQAEEIRIELQPLENTLILTVTDDGIGFQGTLEDMHKKGVGLKIIASRVKTMQGKLSFDSSKQKGTTVIAAIPIK